MKLTHLPPRALRIEAPLQLCFQVIASGGVLVDDRGDRGRVVRFESEAGGRKVVTTELVRLEPPRRISYEWLEGPLPVVHETIELHPLTGGVTELRYRGRFGLRPSVFGPIARRVVRRQFDRAVRAHLAEAKALAEARAARTKLFPRTSR